MDLDLEIDEEDLFLENELDEELEYDEFYKKNVKFIKLFFFYLDKNRNIIKIQKETKNIKDSTLFKKDLIDIIDKKKIFLNKTFAIRDILKYNFTLDIENIHDFTNTSSKYKFLHILKNINDIYWEKTIEKFNDVNSLYFIFADNHNSNNKTKKIFFKNKKRKTSKRNLFKKKLSVSSNDIIKLK